MGGLHDVYCQHAASQPQPWVMELPLEQPQDAAIVEEVLRGHFGVGLDAVLEGSPGVDTFCDFARRPHDFDCRLLMVHHELGEPRQSARRPVGRYLETIETIHFASNGISTPLQGLHPGECFDIHLVGTDSHTVISDLSQRLGRGSSLVETGTYSLIAPGEVYRRDHYICVNARIQDPMGIHARPSADIARAASEYTTEGIAIEIVRGNNIAPAQSILRVMGLNMPYNAGVTIRTLSNNPHAEKALQAVYAATQTVY